MCIQTWKRARYECGHIVDTKNDFTTCATADRRGKHCSTTSNSFEWPVDTSGKCSDCS